MSQKNDVFKIWSDLETEAVEKPAGVCKRIVSKSSLYRIYVGINALSKARLFMLEFPIEDTYLFDSVTGSKGIELRIETTGDAAPGCNTCVVISNGENVNNIFCSFAENIIHVAEASDSRKKYTRRIVQRIKLWKTFFENTGGRGLTQTQQIGLFGELDLLDLLITEKGAEVIRFWKGPTSAAQDFQFEDSAVEVKTTTNEYKSTINISNVKQLDKENRSHLFLCFSRYETFEQSGTTLPEIIAKIFGRLAGTEWADMFKDKLLEQGYVDIESEKYKTGYVFRGRGFYSTELPFPKLTSEILPLGIVDVNYVIDLSLCRDNLVDDTVVLSHI